MQRAFSLFELILVVLLISSVSFLFFSNKFYSKEQTSKLQLVDLKKHLLKDFQFKNNIAFICVKKSNLPCYIKVDETILDEYTLKNFFAKEVKVYKYSKDLEEKEFNSQRIENENMEVFFKLEISKDKKHENYLIDTLGSGIYLITSISNEAKKFSSLNEVKEYIEQNEKKVANAFFL